MPELVMFISAIQQQLIRLMKDDTKRSSASNRSNDGVHCAWLTLVEAYHSGEFSVCGILNLGNW